MPRTGAFLTAIGLAGAILTPPGAARASLSLGPRTEVTGAIGGRDRVEPCRAPAGRPGLAQRKHHPVPEGRGD